MSLNKNPLTRGLIAAASGAILVTLCVGPGTTAYAGSLHNQPQAVQALPGSGSITFWDEWTNGAARTAMTWVANEWDKIHPNWPIAERPIPNDSFFAAVRTGIAGTNPPDVLQTEGYESTEEFAQANELANLDSLWSQVKYRYNQPDGASMTGACRYQGTWYCVPWDWDNQSYLFWNESVMKQYHLSPPTSFAQMLADAKVLKAAGVIPFALSDADGWPGMHWYFEFVGQFCGSKAQDSAVLRTGAKWNDPCFVKSAALLQTLAKDGYFPPGLVAENYNVQVTLLESGKAAMAEDGIWLEEPPAANIGGERFPAIAGAPYNATSGWVGTSLSVPAKAKDPGPAMALIKWMATNPAVGNEWATAGDPMNLKGANVHLPGLDATLVGDVENYPQLPPADESLPFAVGNTALYALGQGLLDLKLTPQQFSDQLEAAAAKAGPGMG